MKKAGTPQAEELVPDPQVVREFGITAMSLWRWDRDQTLIARTVAADHQHSIRCRNSISIVVGKLPVLVVKRLYLDVTVLEDNPGGGNGEVMAAGLPAIWGPAPTGSHRPG